MPNRILQSECGWAPVRSLKEKIFLGKKKGKSKAEIAELEAELRKAEKES